jgi:hypothetical protein
LKGLAQTLMRNEGTTEQRYPSQSNPTMYRVKAAMCVLERKSRLNRFGQTIVKLQEPLRLLKRQALLLKAQVAVGKARRGCHERW